jgi:PDZ domain/Aspartyl protease
MRDKILLLVAFLVSFIASAQSGFEFETSKNKVVIPFQLINNLIFIPINVNGVELNFLLDTGVEETILLGLDDKDKVSLFNVQKVKLRGLGSDEAIEGLKSTDNLLSVNGLVDKNHNLYIVLDQSFNFSSHVGVPINGIIGFHFFKHHLVSVDYERKQIVVYRDNEKLRKKINKRYSSVPISIEKNKPYVNARVTLAHDSIDAKLLLDLGNSDALWLFENKAKGIALPKNNFEDYLGKGFSGDISGKRARINQLQLAGFQFNDPIIAFPDANSLKNVTMVADRVGSVGGEIFRRFALIFDYNGRKLFLKKSRHFDAKFEYNMSGIEMQNEGMQLVQESLPFQTTLVGDNTDSNERKTQNNFKYKYVLKPVYTVASVRKDSPAERCGLQKGDLVLSINGSNAYNFSLQRINDLLKEEEGKWLYFEVDRNGQVLKFRFQLKSIL